MAWFDATNVDPAVGSANLPIGRHPVIIKSSACVATKSGTGGMLVFSVEIIDGPHKGVPGVYRLNVWNDNTQAAEIAAKQLSAICHVVGVFQLNSEPKGVELFAKPFMVIVEKQKDSDHTQIVGVQDIAGNAPVKGQGPSTPYSPASQQPVQQPVQQPTQQPTEPAQIGYYAGSPSQPTHATQGPSAPAQPSWAQQPPAGPPAWGR